MPSLIKKKFVLVVYLFNLLHAFGQQDLTDIQSCLS